MLRMIKPLILTGALLLLTGCSGTESPSSSSGVTVTPSDTQVLAGATLKMTATGV